MNNRTDDGQNSSRPRRFSLTNENIQQIVGFDVSVEKAADLVSYFQSGRRELETVNHILQSPVDKILDENAAERLFRAYKTQKKNNFYSRFTGASRANRGGNGGSRGRFYNTSSGLKRKVDELDTFKSGQIQKLENENAILLSKIAVLEETVKTEKKKKLITNAEKNIFIESLTNVCLLVKEEDRNVIASDNFTCAISDEAVELELSKIGINTRSSLVKKLDVLF